MATISKTLGGDRLGTGNRMKQQMHDFYRSNKNLSCTFGSTMAAGVLYPCYTNIALKGDTFDIDANAFVRTIPTIGPLYGSFKLQVDFFQVPIRLYMGILHNNTIDIARKMNQVYIPKVVLPAKVYRTELDNGFKDQVNTSALMRYLNISGVGKTTFESSQSSAYIYREFNALPMLAYYDIFKNYYANKQEENAYVITPDLKNRVLKMNFVQLLLNTSLVNTYTITGNDFTVDVNSNFDIIRISGNNLNPNLISLNVQTEKITFTGTLTELVQQGAIGYYRNPTKEQIEIYKPLSGNVSLTLIGESTYKSNSIKLQAFPLSNIDEMRKYLLTQWDLGTKVTLSQKNQNYYPYATNFNLVEGEPCIKYPLNGLCVKTYQSDLFNNWLDSEWVNEITTTSAIDVSNGSFTLDMLNFKKKLYDHLNRLAISGGTYDDWQEATYGDKVFGKSEKPIFCGGMSSEIEFDEVVSTAASGDDVLGTIGGRGTLNGKRGGNITIKVGEASIIMGIVSITPRIMYNQGNAWYNTELDTIDDLHKPIFDRIGFQDLMVEQMAWWDASVEQVKSGDPTIQGGAVSRHSAGKQPAWINYATDIDKVYGDFANDKGTNYMVLTRHYEQGERGVVNDITTYIDPQKFNYAFAYQELDAQNFWTFIRMKIHARRKMSNTQIPNV